MLSLILFKYMIVFLYIGENCMNKTFMYLAKKLFTNNV